MGWSLFPVASLAGGSTFEMQFTSGRFEADMFSMTNATEFEDNEEYNEPADERHIVDGSYQITLEKAPIEGSIFIDGLEETTEDTVEDGKFKVDLETKKITFNENMKDQSVHVIFETKVAVREAKIDNMSSAIGECVAVWPVYPSGDDCTKEAIIGYWYVRVYRAKVTTQPGINESQVPLYSNVYEINFPNTEKLLAA